MTRRWTGRSVLMRTQGGDKIGHDLVGDCAEPLPESGGVGSWSTPRLERAVAIREVAMRQPGRRDAFDAARCPTATAGVIGRRRVPDAGPHREQASGAGRHGVERDRPDAHGMPARPPASPGSWQHARRRCLLGVSAGRGKGTQRADREPATDHRPEARAKGWRSDNRSMVCGATCGWGQKRNGRARGSSPRHGTRVALTSRRRHRTRVRTVLFVPVSTPFAPLDFRTQTDRYRDRPNGATVLDLQEHRRDRRSRAPSGDGTSRAVRGRATAPASSPTLCEPPW